MNVIIFGASKLGEIAYNLLKANYSIRYFSDNDKKKINNLFCNLKIINPKQLYKYHDYKIIIASQYCHEISQQLFDYNLKNLYVFSYIYNFHSKEMLPKVTKLGSFDLSDTINTIQFYSEKTVKSLNVTNSGSNSNKTVLFFAIHFPPAGGGGVQRSLKFVKYLVELNWDVVVVTVGDSYNTTGWDESLVDEIPDKVKLLRIPSIKSNALELNEVEIKEVSKLIFGVLQDKKTIKKLIKKLERKPKENLNLIMQPDRYIYWVNKTLKSIENILDLKSIDIIYTTGNPFSNHFNGYYLKKIFGIPWVADFRDEWTNSPYKNIFYKNKEFEFNLHQELEKNLVNYADKVIAVTPQSSQNYRDIFNLDHNKVTTITNGYDEDDFKNLPKRLANSKFIIVYYGSLYINRLPDSITIAVNNLIKNKKILNNEVVFKIIGKSDEEISKALVNLDVNNVTSFTSYLPHRECIIEGYNSNMLVLYVGKEPEFKSIYPGKIFEYLRLKQPILALSPLGSEVEQLLDKTKSGKNFHPDDIKGIELFIKEKYDLWLTNKTTQQEPINYQDYERRNLTRQLSDVLNEVLTLHEKKSTQHDS